MTFFSFVLQLVFNTEQGLPIAADWLFFNRINVRARQGLRLGPFRCIARLVDSYFSLVMHLYTSDSHILWTWTDSSRAWLVLCSFSGGTVVGDLAPHEAFPIGGTNSVRGYDEGAVGSGRSCVVASGEISIPLVSFSFSLIYVFTFFA